MTVADVQKLAENSSVDILLQIDKSEVLLVAPNCKKVVARASLENQSLNEALSQLVGDCIMHAVMDIEEKN